MNTFFVIYYVITGILVLCVFLLNSETNNGSKSDVLFCLIASILWPIVLFIFALITVFTDCRKIIYKQKKARQQKDITQLLSFFRFLKRLNLLTPRTALKVSAILTKRNYDDHNN